MSSKLLLEIDAKTKFEVSSFGRFKNTGVRILKVRESFAILDSALTRFLQFRSFSGVTEYHLVRFERNLSHCGRVSK